jgi:chitinase
MVRSRRLAAAAALLLGAGLALAGPATAQASDQSQGPRKVVTAYFADWDIYGRGYHVKDIPVDKLNVIQYAFGVPTFTGGVPGCGILDPWADYQRPVDAAESVSGVADNTADPNQHLFGNFNQLRQLKAAHPGLRLEISLGGWTKSTWFASVAATADRRTAFVKACVDTFLKGNLPTGGWPEQAGGEGAAAGLFDGIDLDWEYPTALAGGNVDYGPADRHNATLLAREFRRQLDQLGAASHRHYLLTAALPAAKNSTKYYELSAFVRSLDWANVMTYDFNVPSGTVSAHDTLFTSDPRDPHGNDWTWNTVGTVVWYLRNDVPASKIVVGVPFYANQYIRTAGLYQPFDNTGLDPNVLQWDLTPQPTYHALVDEGGVVTADGQGQQGFTRYWNPWAGEPYLFNPAGPHGSTLIAYSDPRSIGERVSLIRQWHLRGGMAWELSQDSDAHALIGVLSTVLS